MNALKNAFHCVGRCACHATIAWQPLVKSRHSGKLACRWSWAALCQAHWTSGPARRLQLRLQPPPNAPRRACWPAQPGAASARCSAGTRGMPVVAAGSGGSMHGLQVAVRLETEEAIGAQWRVASAAAAVTRKVGRSSSCTAAHDCSPSLDSGLCQRICDIPPWAGQRWWARPFY